MKHRKPAFSILFSLLLGFSFFTSVAPAQVKPIELNYSNFFPAAHKHTLITMDWGKEIEKRTNGRVKVTVFPGGTLTPADKCFDGVLNGISDLGLSCHSYTRGRFPLFEVADLPLGSNSAYVSTKLINEFYRKFKPKEFDKVQTMYLHGNGPMIYHTKKAIQKLEDVKGMKIRCTGLATKIVSALGGAPVAMPMGETYDSLSKGIVDGTMNPFEALEGFKLGEVVKFTTESYGSANSTAFYVVMNKDKWNSLPPDIQKIIEAVNEEYLEKTGRLWDEIDKAGREFTLKLGNQVISLTKEENERFRKAVKPILDDYVKATKEKGLPGEEALKFYLDRLAQLQ